MHLEEVAKVRRRSSCIEVAEGCNTGALLQLDNDNCHLTYPSLEVRRSRCCIMQSVFTSGCPIFRIPKAGVEPHCLALRIVIVVIHSTQLFLPVFKHSNRSPVYRKSEQQTCIFMLVSEID